VASAELFLELELLRRADCENWRFGRVPCLEKVIGCNLDKASRIMKILKRQAEQAHMKASPTVYPKWGKGAKIRLRFSKSGLPTIEAADNCHFVNMALKRAKPASGPPESGPEPAADREEAVPAQEIDPK